MIRDIEGAEVGGGTPRRWLLPATTTVCVAAFLVALVTTQPPLLTTAPSPGAVLLLGPSVIARMSVAPTRRPGPLLQLPQGAYTGVTRLNLSGVTGLVPASAAEAGVLLRYRLPDGRELALTRSRDAISGSTGPTRDVRVRGKPGRIVVSTERGQVTLLVWSEDPLHYQLASATLSAEELLELAERLR